MLQKSFTPVDAILHLPIVDVPQDEMWYVKVLVNGTQVFEFLAGITADEPDFYTPLYLQQWQGSEITLACDDANVPDNLFDGISVGGKIEERPDLYPDMYREPGRQRVHFSSRRGWLNDPNGLVYVDGKFHLSYQHDPFCPNHNSANVSWGLATSEDGVHFT